MAKKIMSVDTTEPIMSDKADTIDLQSIDPRKVYRAVIQLGQRRAWRSFSGGKWVKVETDTEGNVRYEHRPALHETGPIGGETLRGLASSHNSWVDALLSHARKVGTISNDDSAGRKWRTQTQIVNDNRHVDVADVSKQLLVVDFSETNEVASDAPQSTDATERIIEQLGSQISTAMTSSNDRLADALEKLTALLGK
jgi:hypothetical protein